MMPTDIEDVQGYTPLINGMSPDAPWTGLFERGERVRITFVNETMMTHPMHLHGLWSLVDNGSGADMPAKHVIAVAPGAMASIEVEADEPGMWRLHCHLAYHMKAGMMRQVIVEDGDAPMQAAAPAAGHAGHGAMRHGG